MQLHLQHNDLPVVPYSRELLQGEKPINSNQAALIEQIVRIAAGDKHIRPRHLSHGALIFLNDCVSTEPVLGHNAGRIYGVYDISTEVLVDQAPRGCASIMLPVIWPYQQLLFTQQYGVTLGVERDNLNNGLMVVTRLSSDGFDQGLLAWVGYHHARFLVQPEVIQEITQPTFRYQTEQP